MLYDAFILSHDMVSLRGATIHVYYKYV